MVINVLNESDLNGSFFDILIKHHFYPSVPETDGDDGD